MEKLISRWNREKAEAVEKARVFDVEERDDYLHLTKRLSPIIERARPNFILAFLFIIGGGFIGLTEAGPQFDWFSVALPVLIGVFIIIAPLSEIRRTEHGEMWGFDRGSQQVKYNDLLIMSLKNLERVTMRRVTIGENPEYFQLWIVSEKGQRELLDQHGLAQEYLEVGQRIADFAQVPFVKHEAD